VWIHFQLVGVSHFAECRENRSATVTEMLMNNANKSPKIPYYEREQETDTESVSGTVSPPKVNKFF